MADQKMESGRPPRAGRGQVTTEIFGTSAEHLRRLRSAVFTSFLGVVMVAIGVSEDIGVMLGCGLFFSAWSLRDSLAAWKDYHVAQLLELERGGE
jgi:hypothetical protein